MTPMDITILVVFSAWAVLSVLSQQARPGKNKLKALDLLDILPNYKFFCPNPITYDYHLYYRTGSLTGLPGEWKEIYISKKTAFLCAIWNPSKKNRKVFTRIINEIIKRKDGKPKKLLRKNTYLLLRNFVEYMARDDNSIKTAFKITYKHDLNNEPMETILYASEFQQYELPRSR
jgi:hypothetical protein